MQENKNVLKKLLIVQQNIKAPKGQYNSFGKFSYRSCEDILEQARPLCNDNGAVLILSDEVKNDNGRYYIVATATLYDADSGESISVTANAREADEKKGMDTSQVTGASSSYARKYALCGLFSLDDNKDADTMDNTKEGCSKQDKDKLFKSIITKMNTNHITNDVMTKILESKYQKYNSKQLTITELTDLDKNLLIYTKEITGK
jgi:hypothetical protein|nr:MAG TPA: ERF superfamily protein [Caudoviricetes sp.]